MDLGICQNLKCIEIRFPKVNSPLWEPYFISSENALNEEFLFTNIVKYVILI